MSTEGPEEARRLAVDVFQRLDDALGRPPFTMDSAERSKPLLLEMINVLTTKGLQPPLPVELSKSLPILFTAYVRAADPLDVECLRLWAECSVEGGKFGALGYSLREAAKVVAETIPTERVAVELLKVAYGSLDGEAIKIIWESVLFNPSIADDVLKNICQENLSAESASIVLDGLKGDGFRKLVRQSETAYAVLTRWSEPLMAQGLRPVDLLHVIDRRTFGDWVVLCERAPHTILVALRSDDSDPRECSLFRGNVEEGKECVRECLKQRERIHVGRLLAATMVVAEMPACADASAAADFFAVFDDAMRRTRRLPDALTVAERGVAAFAACGARVDGGRKAHAFVEWCEATLRPPPNEPAPKEKNKRKGKKATTKDSPTTTTPSPVDARRFLRVLRRWVDVVDDEVAEEVARRTIAEMRVLPRAWVEDVYEWLMWGLRGVPPMKERWKTTAIHVMTMSKSHDTFYWDDVLETLTVGELSLTQWASLNRMFCDNPTHQAGLARAAVTLAMREGVESVATAMAPTVEKYLSVSLEGAVWGEIISNAASQWAEQVKLREIQEVIDAEAMQAQREERSRLLEQERIKLAQVAAEKEAALQKELEQVREHLAAALSAETEASRRPKPPSHSSRSEASTTSSRASTATYLAFERALQSSARYLLTLGVPTSVSLPRLRTLGPVLSALTPEALAEFAATGATAPPDDVARPPPTSFWAAVAAATEAAGRGEAGEGPSVHRRLAGALDAFDFSINPPPPLPRWVVENVGAGKVTVAELVERRLARVVEDNVELTALAVAFHRRFADPSRVVVFIEENVLEVEKEAIE